MKYEYMPPKTFNGDAVYRLVQDDTLLELKIGDTVKLHDGDEVVIVGLYPPHKTGASGKVSVSDKRRKSISIYYAGVIDATFEEVISEEAAND